MELDEAISIYHSPKGHSKEELRECLRVLNSMARPKQTDIQQKALLDANLRLIALNKGIRL